MTSAEAKSELLTRDDIEAKFLGAFGRILISDNRDPNIFRSTTLFYLHAHFGMFITSIMDYQR